MPLYSYVARDISGNRISGEMDAINKEDLEILLNKKGMILLSNKKVSSISATFSRKMKMKDIIIFSRQLSVMVTAGITIQEAIHLLADGAEKKVVKENLINIYEDLKAGVPLSESMKRRDVFDDFMIGMVRIGEFSGAFDDIMKRVADFYENDGKMKSSVKSALVYPIILCVMALAVITYLLVGIIPQFEAMFTSLDAELPWITRMVQQLSTFVIGNALLIIAVNIVVLTMTILYLKSPGGKYKLHGWLLRVPIVNTLIVKLITARFSRCMDILTKSGVTIVQSFDLVDSMISNLVVRDKFKLCKEGIISGYSYASSLKRVEYFPPMLISMVIVGESTGSLSEVFDKTSSFFDEEATAALKALVQLIEPIMLVIIGFLVLIIILAIMLPMADMLSNLA